MVGHFGDAAFSAYRWGKPLVLGIGGTAVIHAEEPRKILQQIHKSSSMPGAWQTLRMRLELFCTRRCFVRPRFGSCAMAIGVSSRREW